MPSHSDDCGLDSELSVLDLVGDVLGRLSINGDSHGSGSSEDLGDRSSQLSGHASSLVVEPLSDSLDLLERDVSASVLELGLLSVSLVVL